MLIGDENYPHRLLIEASRKRGAGRIAIHGLIESSVEAPIAAAVSAADQVSDMLERPSAQLSANDLTIRVTVPSAPESPIVGESFHLALAVSVLFLLTRMQAPGDTIFTGGCDEDGRILSIGLEREKRKGAAMLGFRRIVLPVRNFDFFSRDVVQSPVRNLLEVFAL